MQVRNPVVVFRKDKEETTELDVYICTILVYQSYNCAYWKNYIGVRWWLKREGRNGSNMYNNDVFTLKDSIRQ